MNHRDSNRSQDSSVNAPATQPSPPSSSDGDSSPRRIFVRSPAPPPEPRPREAWGIPASTSTLPRSCPRRAPRRSNGRSSEEPRHRTQRPTGEQRNGSTNTAFYAPNSRVHRIFPFRQEEADTHTSVRTPNNHVAERYSQSQLMTPGNAEVVRATGSESNEGRQNQEAASSRGPQQGMGERSSARSEQASGARLAPCTQSQDEFLRALLETVRRSNSRGSAGQ